MNERDPSEATVREERDPPLTKPEVEARQQRGERLKRIQSRVAQVIREQNDAPV